MGFKLTKPTQLTRLLKSTEKTGLINDVRKEFEKRGPVKVKQAIVQDMIKGISPVQGGGRWKRYSDSYKETIRGKATYRKFGGKVVKFPGRDKAFMDRSKPTKQVSPVNLRHSGELHRSLNVFTKSKTLYVQFKHFLADIHNRRGAGKSKVVRRMLPTKRGETFNRTITKVLIGQLKNATEIVAKRISNK